MPCIQRKLAAMRREQKALLPVASTAWLEATTRFVCAEDAQA